MTDRAALRRLAEEAARDFGPARRIAEGRSGRDVPPVHTPPADRLMVLRIECGCGHAAVITAKPADILARALRCSKCGKPPPPF